MKIDSNVPLPPRIAGRVRIGPLPLLELEIGDSILVECEPDEVERVLHSVRVRLSRFRSKNRSFKFSSTAEKKGVRIWRVKENT
jgi:hypothetical protein